VQNPGDYGDSNQPKRDVRLWLGHYVKQRDNQERRNVLKVVQVSATDTLDSFVLFNLGLVDRCILRVVDGLESGES
jgi:hypothetical protein